MPPRRAGPNRLPRRPGRGMAGSDRRNHRPAHRGRPGRHLGPAARWRRRDHRARRLDGRSRPPATIPTSSSSLVGDSAKARKGSSWDHVDRTPARADRSLPRPRPHRPVHRGRTDLGARDPDGADPGVADPRLLVVEPEFVTVLKATGRDVNTLSPGAACRLGRPPPGLAHPHRPRPRHRRPHRRHRPHHRRRARPPHQRPRSRQRVLEPLLLHRLPAHRACCPKAATPTRSPAPVSAARLARHLAAARRTGPSSFNPAARLAWHDAYARLAEPTDGLVGALLARAEAHVLRLAMLYALVDGDSTIGPAHLHAGLALWDYAARSVAWALRHTSHRPRRRTDPRRPPPPPTASPAPSYATSSAATCPAPASTPPSPPSARRPGPTSTPRHRRPTRRGLGRHDHHHRPLKPNGHAGSKPHPTPPLRFPVRSDAPTSLR